MTVYQITTEDLEVLDNLFTYHPPLGDQAQRYTDIRAAGKRLAEEIMWLCPPSAERTLARRAVEEAVMRANQAIAVNEKPDTTHPDYVEGFGVPDAFLAPTPEVLKQFHPARIDEVSVE